MSHLLIDSELKELLTEISAENKSLSEWREIESSGMFQAQKYCGGFDAIEDKFTFSYYPNQNEEFWFELTLGEIDNILNNEITEVKLRVPS